MRNSLERRLTPRRRRASPLYLLHGGAERRVQRRDIRVLTGERAPNVGDAGLHVALDGIVHLVAELGEGTPARRDGGQAVQRYVTVGGL